MTGCGVISHAVVLIRAIAAPFSSGLSVAICIAAILCNTDRFHAG
jgi:hypothetical protein